MKKYFQVGCLISALLFLQRQHVSAQTTSTASQKQTQKPIPVHFTKTGDAFQLLRDGKPYYVNGAGGGKYPDRIAAYGGNSIRTWGSKGAGAVLDSASKYGLTVLLGLDVARERHGFNYDDTAAVAKQLAGLRAEVMKYKNHPALLAWGIGNELNLQYKNPKVWDAVNQVSIMIHQEDANHPTCTVLAGINKTLIDYLKARTTDLDFLGINTYGDLARLPQTVKSTGLELPYLVTEWGPTGHWEGLQTEWKSPIEETSAEKAAVYQSRYEYSMMTDRRQCLGSYVFLWGQKQERTPTWYGLFTEKGEESEVMDVMQFLWSGRWPMNRAPHLYSFQLDNRIAVNNIYLAPGTLATLKTFVSDPDNDRITYRYELLTEPVKLSEGGDFEQRPETIAGMVKAGPVANGGVASAELTVPTKTGAYRVFVYATDGHNNVATANIPFFVK